MAEQQFTIITARVVNNAVVLSTRDPNLTQGIDGSWTFTIIKETPPEVVFLLDIGDGGNGWTVRSTLRLDGDKWSDPVDWTRERLYVSPGFVHGNDLRIEVQRSKSSTSTVRGGGFYQIRDQGGGGDF